MLDEFSLGTFLEIRKHVFSFQNKRNVFYLSVMHQQNMGMALRVRNEMMDLAKSNYLGET